MINSVEKWNGSDVANNDTGYSLILGIFLAVANVKQPKMSNV